MKKNCLSIRHVCLLLVWFVCLSTVSPAFATEIEVKSDPQFVVINFADMYYLDWDADEQTWQTVEKPKALQSIQEMREQLGDGNAQSNRLKI